MPNPIIRFTVVARWVIVFLAFSTPFRTYAEPLAPPPSTSSVSGNISARYNLRYDSGTSEAFNTFNQTVDLTYTPRAFNSTHFAFSGEAFENPGKTDTRAGSYWQSYGRLEGFVYEAYAKTDRVFPNLGLQLGRFYHSREFTVHIDGINSEYSFSGNRGSCYVFTGIPADPLDKDATTRSLQAGAGLTYAFGESAGTGIEYLMTRDAPDNDTKETFHQGAVSFYYNTQASHTGISVSSLDSEIARVRLNTAVITGEDGNGSINLSYTHQFIDLERMPSSSSPFIRILGPEKSYQQVTAYACTSFKESGVHLAGGADWRNILGHIPDTDFNHSFTHGFLAIGKDGLISPRLDVTLHADYWQNLNVSDDKKSVVTGGCDCDLRLDEKNLFQAGSFYSLYSYDYYSDLNEKTDVYTVFSRLVHAVNKRLKINGEYSLDITDSYDHRFILSANAGF